MPLANLKDKTIMIATTDKMLARIHAEALENLGAAVVFSDHSPHHPSSIPVISEEVEKHQPKIDALVIHNSNIDLRDDLWDAQTTALELTQRLKEARPVIVCDLRISQTSLQPLQTAGAKYLNFSDMGPHEIAAAVADIVAQHGKPVRQVAV